MSAPERLFLNSEAAAFLRISPDALRDIVQAGEIECFRRGTRGWIRFSRGQLTDYLERTRVPARATASTRRGAA
jgi:hypothetical protein